MTKKILALVCLVSLTGCASSPTSKPFYVQDPSFKTVQIPERGEVAMVELGQTMVITAKRADIPAIRIAEAITHSGGKHGTTYSLTIPSGVLSLQATNSSGKFYQAAGKQNIRWGGVLGGNYPIAAGVFVPNDSLRTTEVYYGGVDGMSLTASEPHPNIEFTRDTVEVYAAGGFKRELVYAGTSQNTVSILYREFIDGMARPAFSQDLKYDLAQSDIIGYNGARFQVINANNTTIKFRVITPLN